MKVFLTRPYHTFAATLTRIGVPTKVLERGRQSQVYVQGLAEKNGDLYFIWGGAIRRLMKNTMPKAPGLAYSELGYMPHYKSLMLDPLGHAAGSAILQANIPQADASQKAALKKYLKEYYFKKSYDESKSQFHSKNPFYLFALQHPRDSVMMFDCPSWARDTQSLVTELANNLPSGATLVVKQHPKHVQKVLHGLPKNVTLLPAIQNDALNTETNHYLINHAEAVLAVNSNYIFEALVRGKPVISFGTGIFSGRGLTKEVNHREFKGIFDNLVFDQDKIDSFLYEVLFYRQVADAEHDNPEAVERVWYRFKEVHQEFFPGYLL